MQAAKQILAVLILVFVGCKGNDAQTAPTFDLAITVDLLPLDLSVSPDLNCGTCPRGESCTNGSCDNDDFYALGQPCDLMMQNCPRGYGCASTSTCWPECHSSTDCPPGASACPDREVCMAPVSGIDYCEAGLAYIGGHCTQPNGQWLCAQKSCNAGLTCDPDTGLCK